MSAMACDVGDSAALCLFFIRFLIAFHPAKAGQRSAALWAGTSHASTWNFSRFEEEREQFLHPRHGQPRDAKPGCGAKEKVSEREIG